MWVVLTAKSDQEVKLYFDCFIRHAGLSLENYALLVVCLMILDASDVVNTEMFARFVFIFLMMGSDVLFWLFKWAVNF